MSNSWENMSKTKRTCKLFYKIRTKDMRIAAISGWNAHRILAKAAVLAYHRSAKITTSHYIKSAIEFNSITPK